MKTIRSTTFYLIIFCSLLRGDELPEIAFTFLDNHCLSCHDSVEQEGDFDMEALSFDLADPEVFERWVKVYDRTDHGEMPPKKKKRPETHELAGFLEALAEPLVAADRARMEAVGRSTVRRYNRFEYENTLRDVLAAPWLQVADRLPEDGTAHLFNKVGNRLDVSHVQMTKYLETADYALRVAMNAAAFPSETKKFYAREEPVMQNYLWYRPLQRSATRSAVPLIGLTPDLEILRQQKPVTVGESDPELREQEALGFFSGTYAATTKYDFTRLELPIDGRYRLRIKSYTFMAGPNGASGGDDQGLTGGSKAQYRPNRAEIFPGYRSEPMTLYALAESGDSRWLTTYDTYPEPSVVECVVDLKQGEGIRPDAARLVRTRPGWKGNPNLTEVGVPGVAFNWLEIEGPLHASWPPPSYEALFGDLPFTVGDSGRVEVQSKNPDRDARRLLSTFVKRVFNRPLTGKTEADPYVEIYQQARRMGESFTDAMIAGFVSVLCAPDFLYLESQAGELENHELALRLSYFLWNGPPDDVLRKQKHLHRDRVLTKQAIRMLDDPRSDRFLHAFLDYWLELREINANSPDASLYTDYYLDDMLTESSLRETRLFFRELVDKNLPVRNLIDSDFTFVNERLARHYELEPFEGVDPRRVTLPQDSPRGGLLTQASVLRVTANGTTTSPVLRGAWVMERIMGVEIPPPPSGIEAIEPDTRGATTIREQLTRHNDIQSCNACHEKFDPAGFALESFDVAGGWRDRYRAVDESVEPADGLGKNGHAFLFHYAQTVDSSGVLKDGRSFGDIFEFKELLIQDERAVARNLVNQFIVYATGAPVSFADRAEVEKILDNAAADEFGVRTLLLGVVTNTLFKIK